MSCPLCVPPEPERILWRDAQCRVIDAGEAGYPGYCRVVWGAHVREMTDLAPPEPTRLLEVVCGVESALRALLEPVKINLASLGNYVPHLHWHVIARFPDDPHYPDAIWAPARRQGSARPLDREALRAALVRHLGPGI